MEGGLIRPEREYRQLQQLISGLDDGIILVDLDQTILWANDRALALHRVSRVEDLGADIDAYRRRFRLTYRNKSPIKHGDFPIERMIAGEQSQDVTVEVCPIDEPDDPWIHTIRCLVISDDEKNPDYLVLVIDDQTDRYEAEDRFESAFNANPAPAIICRLSDLCFVRVNEGFLEMTGCRREDVVGRSVYEFDILAGLENRAGALQQLKAWRTVGQGEALLSLPDGQQKCVIVAGQPIEVSDEKCMLFTFADLDPRRRAETALRHSEERFSKSFKLSPAALTICSLESFRFSEVNEAFTKLTGYGREQVIGRSASELNLWADQAAQTRFDLALASAGSVAGADFRVRRADGSIIDCLLSAETITIDDARCVLCVIQDITERKRSEEELVAAIEAVMSETSWFSRTIVEKLASVRQSTRVAVNDADLASLTNRERDALGLICQGLGDAEMADLLHLSRHTVRNHLSSLYRKIGVKRRTAAVAWARDRGISGTNGTKLSSRQHKGQK